MSVKKLKKRIENAKKHIIPYDLFNRYYDSLSRPEKQRYWDYVYEGAYTLEQAEIIEVNYIRGTLHFICEMTLFDSLNDPEFVKKINVLF